MLRYSVTPSILLKRYKIIEKREEGHREREGGRQKERGGGRERERERLLTSFL